MKAVTPYMSGLVALDMDEEVLHEGDIGAQAEVMYGSILQLLGARRPGVADLLETVE